MTQRHRYRLGFDIGGTFTDFVLIDETTGEALLDKCLTTPADPARAVIEGLEGLLAKADLAGADIDIAIHATTLITNAVIAWNTVYMAHATRHLQQNGTPLEDRHIARLSPAGHAHINFYGRYDFTNPQPPPNGTHRPLRVELDRRISSI